MLLRDVKIDKAHESILEFKDLVTVDLTEFKNTISHEVKVFTTPLKNIVEIQNKIDSVF